MIHGHDLMC